MASADETESALLDRMVSWDVGRASDALTGSVSAPLGSYMLPLPPASLAGAGATLPAVSRAGSVNDALPSSVDVAGAGALLTPAELGGEARKLTEAAEGAAMATGAAVAEGEAEAEGTAMVVGAAIGGARGSRREGSMSARHPSMTLTAEWRDACACWKRARCEAPTSR